MSTQAAADHRSGSISPRCWHYKNFQMQIDICESPLLHLSCHDVQDSCTTWTKCIVLCITRELPVLSVCRPITFGC